MAGARLAILAGVVVASGGEGELTSIAVEDAAGRAASFLTGTSVVSRAELPAAFEDALRDCGADARCIAARLDTAGVELGLSIVVNTKLSPALMTARLVDARKSAELFTRTVELTDRSLVAQVEREVMEMFRASGMAVGGRLEIAVSPADATLSNPGGVLTAGEYEIAAVRDGYVSTSTRARVIAGRETRVMIKLAEDQSVFGSTWFWIGAGVAVACGTAFVVAAATSRGRMTISQVRDEPRD